MDSTTSNVCASYRQESEISVNCKEKPCWLGIDEAGRGPVLGPMVYGTCFSPLENKEDLCRLGFADSKVLTEQRRSELFDVIKKETDLIGWMVHVLSPEYLSNCMLSYLKYNLNEVSHDTAIGLIQGALDRGVNVSEVYVDTVGDPGKYQAKLEKIFPDLKITVAKKADSLYAIVSAASICAKVTRDDVVSGWTFREGSVVVPEGGYGSGYPGDALTKEFLQNNVDKVFGFPSFVRFSWSTAKKIIEDQAIQVLWEDEKEDKDSSARGLPMISTYFQPQKSSRKRCHFFENCGLKVAKTI